MCVSNFAFNSRTKRAATARPERIWDYAVIPYEIDANFSGNHKALFKQVTLVYFVCIKCVCLLTSPAPPYDMFILFIYHIKSPYYFLCCTKNGSQGSTLCPISMQLLMLQKNMSKKCASIFLTLKGDDGPPKNLSKTRIL